MKNKLLLTVLILALTPFFTFSQNGLNLNYCKLRTSIDISTGYDHENSVFYPNGDKDQYWSIVSGPGNPQDYPTCATSHGWSHGCGHPTLIPTSGSRMLGLPNPTALPTMNHNCGSIDPDYVFERTFRLAFDNPGVWILNLNFIYKADDKVSRIELIGPGITTTIHTAGGCSEQGICKTINHNVNVSNNGVYRLKFTVRNECSGTACWVNPGNSIMNFELNGVVRIMSPGSPKRIVDNKYFGKRVPLDPPMPGVHHPCAPPYEVCDAIFESFLVGNECIPTNSAHTFLIVNYCPTSTYTLTEWSNVYPPKTATGPSFTGVGPGNYTLTVTDADNCQYEQDYHFGVPSFTASPLVPCVPPPTGKTGVTIAPTYNTTVPIPYDAMQINSGGWQPPPFSPYLGPGNHTIEIRDVNGCITSSAVTIGNEFTASLTGPPFCFNAPGLLTANTQPGSASIVGATPLTYDFKDASNLTLAVGTSNTLPITTGGLYSVVVTDDFGCSATASVTTVEKPVFTHTQGPCAPTNVVITSANSPNYLYSLNNGPFTTASNIPTITTGGMYTLTASSGVNCTTSVTFPVLGTNGCCFTAAQVQNAGVVIPHGYSVSQMAGWNPSIGFTSNQDVIIEGDFIIDIPIQFSNCPNILMGPDAHIIVNPGQFIHIDHSTLQAGCSEMWKGITATELSSEPGAFIYIDQSTLRDMEDGVQSISGAGLQLTDNSFIQNIIGVQIKDADPGFDIQSGRSIVQGNTFNYSPSLTMLPPCLTCAVPTKGEHGIILERCEKVEIGADQANFSSSDGNDFLNLYNGIIIRPDGVTGQADQYNLRANEFFSMHDDYNSTSFGNEYHVHNNIYASYRGSGIYCRPSAHMNNSAHQLNVSGDANNAAFYDFDDCDKAVVLHGLSANISQTKMTNCIGGYMMANTDGHNYTISDNLTEGTFISTQLNGKTNSARILKNHFRPRTANIQYGSSHYYWPKGIEVNDLFPSANTIHISGNTIAQQAMGGEGIVLSRPGPGTYVGFNNINFENNSTLAGPSSLPDQEAHLYGIRIRRGEECVVEENTVQGQVNYQSLWTANPANRWSSAIGVEHTRGISLKCNHMDNTNDGFRILGDCNTGADKVAKNDFHDHVVPMLFLHMGSEGTTGDIGTLANNNDNVFTQGNDPINWPSPHNGLGQFGNPVKLFRITTCPNFYNEVFHSDYGNPTHVLQNESWSNAFGNCTYSPLPNSSYTQHFCSTGFEPLSIMQGDESVKGDERIDIAIDSVVYSEFNEVAEWMDENYLYRHLDVQPTLRSAHSEYSNFYAAEQSDLTDELWSVDQGLDALTDSSLMRSSATWTQQMSNVSTQNLALQSSKNYESNERIINELYLTARLSGMDNMSSTDKNTITSLAHACPFVEGDAVYKARVLNALLQPGMSYNDRAICNAAGVYKNGGPFDGEDDLLTQGAVQGKKRASLGHVKLFPNPTHGFISIDYELAADAELIFYDVLGREMTKILLNGKSHFTQKDLPLVSGMYVWKCVCEGEEIETGKLVIE